MRVGRVEIVSVIRVDDKAGYIDLSKKRVSSEEKTHQCERYEKAKSVHSIIYSVGAHTGVPVETLYENIGWPLYKRYGHGFEVNTHSTFQYRKSVQILSRACARFLQTPTYCLITA